MCSNLKSHSAIGILPILVVLLAWVLIPRLIGWSLALPLVLFEGVAAGEALAESRLRVRSHRCASDSWERTL